MASDDIYDELGAGEELYDDVAAITHNGHVPNHSYNQPPLPNPRVDPKAKTKTMPARKAGQSPPTIPSRAPTTSLSQTMPKKQEKKKGKGKKETKQAPPPPVSGGGLMQEMLQKRQTMNTRRFEDFEKPKKDEGCEERQLAPWQLEKKKVGQRSSLPSQDTRVNDDEDDVPEFIKKRRSMSFADDDDNIVTPSPPPPVAYKPPPTSPIKSIKEEESGVTANKLPPVQPKPKPAPRKAPKPPSDKPVSNSPPTATKPKPTPPSRKDSLISEKASPPLSRPPFSSNSVERNTKPPVAVPPKPGTRSKDSSPHNECRPDNNQPQVSKPPLFQPEELPPPSFKPPPPQDSPPTVKAPPPKNVTDSPPIIRPALTNNSPSLIRKPEPKPPVTLTPKPLESLPPKQSEGVPPSFKPAPPIPPVQSRAEPTPPIPSVLKYRRLPLPAVDLNNPPPLPSRSKKPTTGTKVEVVKRPSLIPTESQDIDEDIYDDTVAITNDIDDEQAIYDDTIGIQSELESVAEGEELYDDVTTLTQQPPSLPSRPEKLPPVPTIEPPPIPSSIPPSIRSPPPTISVPPIPTDDEQENYEVPGMLQNQGNPANLQRDGLGNVPPLPPSPRSSLPPPPGQQFTPSPQGSPTLSRKNLTKEERKQIKEDEKRVKEQKRLDLQREKDRKRREELKAKNRQKTMKAFKDYKLPEQINPLFSVEILMDRKASKDHMAVTAGEKMSVVLITHEKLPRGKYLVEKEDGSIGLVDEKITERTVYQSAQQLGIQQNHDFGYADNEDIYEPLDTDPVSMEAPSLPPMNPSNTIPTEEEDFQDVYECLPDN